MYPEAMKKILPRPNPRGGFRSLCETMTTMLDPVEVQRTLVGSVVEEMFLESGILLAAEGEEF